MRRSKLLPSFPMRLLPQGSSRFCNAFHYRDLAPIFARRRFCCIKRRCGAAYVVSIATMYLSPCSIACHYMQLLRWVDSGFTVPPHPLSYRVYSFSFRRLSLPAYHERHIVDSYACFALCEVGMIEGICAAPFVATLNLKSLILVPPTSSTQFVAVVNA